jgi:hypothetical protein
MKRALGAIVVVIAAVAFAVAALSLHSTTAKSPTLQQLVPAGAPHQSVPAPVEAAPPSFSTNNLAPPGTLPPGQTLRPCTPPECHSTP